MDSIVAIAKVRIKTDTVVTLMVKMRKIMDVDNAVRWPTDTLIVFFVLS